MPICPGELKLTSRNQPLFKRLIKEMLNENLHWITGVMFSGSAAALYNIMKAGKLCYLWGKNPMRFSKYYHRYFNKPSSVVIPLYYLLWVTVKGAKSWMTAAPVEWHPEAHALLKNVSSASVCIPQTPWQVGHSDFWCMIMRSFWNDWRKKQNIPYSNK